VSCGDVWVIACPIASVIVIFCILGVILSKPEYEPHLDRLVWDAVREFVTNAVEDTIGRTAYGPSELNMAASRLAAWCWQSAGLPLERNIVFSRRVIARFVAVGCPTLKPAARGNLRSQLLRMSEVLAEPSMVVRRLSPLPPSDPSAPYSAQEMRALSSWASTQSTAARRANAEVLIAAGAGAGLSAAEVGELRVRDIEVDDHGVVLVIGGERPRRVPVLREWEQPLINRTKALAPERFAFRENHTAFYPNLITNFVDRSKVIGVRPQSQRLRSTWILHHLNAATPVVPLMRAAGVESLEAFTRYVRFVGEISSDAERDFLRDA
jgi:integrase